MQAYASESSSITLSQNAAANSNVAADDGGGFYLQQVSTLTVLSSLIHDNTAGDRGGGVIALSSSIITLSQGASIDGNTGKNGAGVFLEASSLIVSSSTVRGNTASHKGGGVFGLMSSSVTLNQGASTNGNKASVGGGLYLEASMLASTSSSIYSNTAGIKGAGVYATASSSITLGESTSIVQNVVGGSGGGICIAQSSTLALSSSTSICSNSAQNGGGGIFASASTVRLGSSLTLCNNTAAYGGALALIEASILIDSEDSSHSIQTASRTLTVKDNTASGYGGGLAVSGNSIVNLGVTVVVISRNAADRGGGVFINASQQVTGSSNSTECSSTEKVVFWRLDLVDNMAKTGDGGGMFSGSNILLRQGGQTNATGNTAVRGAAIALSYSHLSVQSMHILVARRNLAEKDGGAIALLSGARLVLLEADICPASCESSERGGQNCDNACMSAACNWDEGGCVAQQMEQAGPDALIPCDRDLCRPYWQTNSAAGVDGCSASCFTASCDWSRELCVGHRESVKSCPLIDAAAFASIRETQQQQASTPVFLTDGNSQGGFGRCSTPCQQPASSPDASSMLGAGIVGSSALHLITQENSTDSNGFVHVAMNSLPDEISIQLGFTVELWMQVPITCAGVDKKFSFVVAGAHYALALRGTPVDGASSPFVYSPLFFWAAPPTQRCSVRQVLTARTGSISDGPGLLSRYEADGPVSCSWVLSPGGSAGGFKDVTLIFTEFLLTSLDTLALYSCLDAACTEKSEATIFAGGDVPPPFVSTTSMMLVILTQFQGAWASSKGFTASYAGTPTMSIGLQAGVWHHISLTVSASGLAAILINGTQQNAHQLPWDPFPTQNMLSVGEHATAIGRGSPAWQDGGDFLYACIAVDELRFWTSERSTANIISNMYVGCHSLDVGNATAQLAACYDFDIVSSAAGFDDFFADASPNNIPAVAAAHSSPYLPWCVNLDDGGELKLDDSESYDWSAKEMWGYCSSKPRLPGAGYAYTESAMEAVNAHRLAGTVAVLEHYPGCGDFPLRISENIAGRYGGAIYYDSCFRLDTSCFLHGIAPLSSSRAVMLGYNQASAGGGVYIDCKDMGVCAEVFADTNTIGALPLLPKVEFTGSTSSAYGPRLATKPIRMECDQQVDSSILLVPGQQPLTLSVTLFDSVGNGSLVIGSEDVIEVLICSFTGVTDGCSFSNDNVLATNKAFNALTGLSSIQAAVECDIGQSDMAFQIRVLGAEYIEKIQGRIVCQPCDIGQRRDVHRARGTWNCETCGPDTYSANPASQAESGRCLACPPSATCVNGAPPIFGASKVTGEMEMELPEGDNGDYVLRKALAVKMGVDASKIVLSSKQSQQRRAVQKVSFELVADTAQMQDLTSQLASLGLVLGGIQSVGPQTANGEVWEQIDGQFILRSCSPGNRLINTTDDGELDIDRQRCSPCGVTTYILDPLGPCQKCPKVCV